MAQPSISGSALGNITARRAQLSKIRQRLNMEGVGASAPQSNLRQVAPSSPTGPAQAKETKVPDELANAAPADDQRAAMLDRIREFQAVNAGAMRGEAPPKTETPALQREQRPLLERLQAVGAAALTPQQQFMRLAGRPPSPRESSLFNARILLERQLGRPPTTNEMRMFVTRPAISPSFPRAMEA